MRRERALADGSVSAAAEWALVEARPVRPDGKALKLVQVQLAYAEQRRLQVAAQAAELRAADRPALLAEHGDLGPDPVLE